MRVTKQVLGIERVTERIMLFGACTVLFLRRMTLSCERKIIVNGVLRFSHINRA